MNYFLCRNYRKFDNLWSFCLKSSLIFLQVARKVGHVIKRESAIENQTIAYQTTTITKYK